MRIAVTGSTGNLGGQLIRVFARDPAYEVVSLTRKDFDMTEPDQVFDTFRRIRPDVVVNTAAYNTVDRCEMEDDEFELACRINGEAVGFLACASIENGSVLVHYSTDYVFRGDRVEGYAEEDEPDPINRYGLSKLLGERALLRHKEAGLKGFLVRTSKLFGPKAHSEHAKPSFFDMMLARGRRQSALDVVDEEKSCFTYTPDLAGATKEMLENMPPYGIYHFVNSGPCTWYEAAQILFNLAGIKVTLRPVSSDRFPRPAKRPKFSVLLNTRLAPLRSWKSALKEYLSQPPLK